MHHMAVVDRESLDVSNDRDRPDTHVSRLTIHDSRVKSLPLVPFKCYQI